MPLTWYRWGFTCERLGATFELRLIILCKSSENDVILREWQCRYPNCVMEHNSTYTNNKFRGKGHWQCKSVRTYHFLLHFLSFFSQQGFHHTPYMVVCVINCCYYSFIWWYKHPLEKSESPTVHFLINKNIFILRLYVICAEVSFASSPIRVFSCIVFFSFLNFYNRNLSLHNIPRTTMKSPEKNKCYVVPDIFCHSKHRWTASC